MNNSVLDLDLNVPRAIAALVFTEGLWSRNEVRMQ